MSLSCLVTLSRNPVAGVRRPAIGGWGLLLLGAVAGLVTPAAHAQEPPADATQPEPPALPTPQEPGGDDPTGLDDPISLDDWERDDWALVKPQTSLIELDGYMRLRGDMLRRLSFKNRSVFLSEGRWPPVNNGDADAVGTNMRLRVEPTINVSEGIQIVTTFDLLDNLVLGSTPNTAQYDGRSLSNIENDTQLPPQAGRNAAEDSIVVRRAYARITALNEQLELRFGRMPNHWGLGMLANAGDCLDCDFGDVVDRISVSFKAAGHVFTPMFDWVSNGPVYNPYGRSGGQTFDAVDWDDVFQYSLQVSKIDHPDDIADAVRNGRSVINYGLWNILRFQFRDFNRDFYEQGGNGTYRPVVTLDPDTINDLQERRDANPVYTGDAFFRWYWGGLTLAGEFALTLGTISEPYASNDNATSFTLEETEIFRWGGALELTYDASGGYSGLQVGLKGGVASGDPSPGFGALQPGSQRGRLFEGRNDTKLENFVFSPDYHVDLLLFRRIVGAVTDAFYVRPEVSYQFNERLYGSLAAIYSQALYKRSTPSCYSTENRRCRGEAPENADNSPSNPMGLEFNAELGYGGKLDTLADGFRASLMGGVLVPFGAFDNPTIENADDRGGSFAWTAQLRLYITF